MSGAVTTEPWDDIAKRLVAHPRFKWAPAMLSQPDGNRVLLAMSDGRVRTDVLVSVPSGWENDHELGVRGVFAYEYPDLTDWPTVGALMRMLVEDTIAVRLTIDADDGVLVQVSATEDSDPNAVWTRHDIPGAAVALALIAVWGEVTP